MSPEARDDFESYRRSMPRPGFAVSTDCVRLRSACEKAAHSDKACVVDRGQDRSSR